jgi:hypothetical protein
MLRRPRGRTFGETSSAATLEFALCAPIMITLTLTVVDVARLELVRAEVHNAANAIAEAAEKLSVTTNATTGAITAELTADQMQQAMSSIYAEIPGLNLGNGGSLFPDPYAVALSSITYTPLCTKATNCGSQTASLLWSSSLSVGGTKLYLGFMSTCGTVPQVTQFADTNGNWNEIPSPVLAGGAAMTLVPQIVADVAYSFTPFFPLFVQSLQVVASVNLPAPIGGLDQTITLNTGAPTGNVRICP